MIPILYGIYITNGRTSGEEFNSVLTIDTALGEQFGRVRPRVQARLSRVGIRVRWEPRAET